MKIEADTLITVASWEQRFSLGFERLMAAGDYRQAVILFSDEYAEWTDGARRAAIEVCNTHDVRYELGVLYAGDSGRTWRETLAKLIGGLAEGSTAVVDVSTMPREIIWQTFWFLHYRKCTVRYVYNRPESYGSWLSRDPDRPRLVYKMSGISRMGARTALLVLAGYDEDRVRHLITTFEPVVTLLGLQMDSVDPQNREHMRQQSEVFKNDSSVVQFWIDAYSSDHGMTTVAEMLEKVAGDHNVIMASMGPKLSAVSLYQLQRRNDTLGLVYLPAREFNPEYSKGIGDLIVGELNND